MRGIGDDIGIGWIIALGSCIFGFLWLGGTYEQLWVPQEYLIIFGAGLGTLMASNKWRNLKSMFRAFLRIFLPSHGGRAANLGLLCLMFELLQRIKRDGALSIESDISDPHQSELFAKYPTVLKSPRLIEFITDYFTMMMDGTVTLGQLESVMAQEIEVMNQEALEPSESIATLADSMPAFGIVAAIIGVVHALTSIKTGIGPDVIGDMISPVKAAVGPDYGALDTRLTAAIHIRFGLPAVLPKAIKTLIKRADNFSAWLEATQIAGFTIAEADKYFGKPPAEAKGLRITPRMPADVRADFIARHHQLIAEIDALSA